MEFTAEQKDIISYYKNETKDILVKANAGSGKTTLLVALSDLAPNNSYFLAFNKVIAEALSEKIIGATCKTLHSFGMGICKASWGSWKVDVKKYRTLIEGLVKKHEDSYNVPKLQRLRAVHIKSLVSVVDSYRLSNQTIPLKVLLKEEGFHADQIAEFLLNVCEQAVIQGNLDKKVMDFTDMIWLPVFNKHEVKVPRVNHLFVDECQDLNPLQYELIKLVDAQRRIFVGDPKQAIYGFSGADAAAFKKAEKEFHATVLPISKCFRVPNDTLNFARTICPSIHSDFNRSPQNKTDWAEILSDNNSEHEVAYLFRSNAELLIKWLSLPESLKHSVTVRWTPNFWSTLYQLMALPEDKTLSETDREAFKTPDFRAFEYVKQNDSTRLVRTLFSHAVQNDRSATWWEVGKYIQELFDRLKNQTTSNIILSTIHQAKGMEWDYVVVSLPRLDEEELDEETQTSQEAHVQLIATTRHKKDLYLEIIEKEQPDDEVE